MAGPNANYKGIELALLPFASNSPWYTFLVTLAGTQYTLVMRYNTRMDRWCLDIGDALGNVLVAGLPVLINTDVAGQYRYLEIPQGVIFFLDDTNTDTQPTRLSFGSTNSGWYLDPTGTT